MRYLFIIPFICMAACNPVATKDPVQGKSVSEDSANIAALFVRTKTSRDSAAYFIRQARLIADSAGGSKLQGIFWILLGKDLIMNGQLDSANSLADKGLQLTYAPNDQNLKGKFYNLKGQIQGLRKNPYASIEYYLKAEKIFIAASDTTSIGGINSNIANAYFSLKDYKTANVFAARAYGLKHSIQDPAIKANIITTYALSLIKIQDTRKALLIEQEADSIATATNNVMARMAATIGFAEIYKTARQFDSSIKYYHQCIALSRQTGVKHFELMSNVGLLSLYEEMDRPEEIIAMADSTLQLATILHNTDILHTSKRIIGRAFAKQNNMGMAFRLLNESYDLYDSTAGIENQKNINELLLKYDAEKKEKEILSQNLLLARQQTQLRNRQLIIAGLLLGLGVLVISYIYVRRLNRERLMRLEVEKQKNIGEAYIYGEQKERTRLAFEIHDGIASMLTGITYKLRAEQVDKGEVITLLKGLHEDTRRISHSLMPIDFERNSLFEAVQTLCQKMSTSEIDVVFLSNTPHIQLDARESLLLYRLVQELINNALKYARCQSIFVRLENTSDAISLSVEDDGIGMAAGMIESGFASIRTRAKLLGAKLSIESAIKEGTTVKISYQHEQVPHFNRG